MAALLCLALALALSYAARRDTLAACGALLAVGLAAAALWQPGLLGGSGPLIACSASIAVTAAAVHLPGGVSRYVAIALAANAGLWLGALSAETSSPAVLLALPAALLAFPGSRMAGRRFGIGLKVASGWLIAIGTMTAALPLLTTPGYVKDHME